jgi:hypothetical protein
MRMPAVMLPKNHIRSGIVRGAHGGYVGSGQRAGCVGHGGGLLFAPNQLSAKNQPATNR